MPRSARTAAPRTMARATRHRRFAPARRSTRRRRRLGTARWKRYCKAGSMRCWSTRRNRCKPNWANLREADLTLLAEAAGDDATRPESHAGRPCPRPAGHPRHAGARAHRGIAGRGRATAVAGLAEGRIGHHRSPANGWGTDSRASPAPRGRRSACSRASAKSSSSATRIADLDAQIAELATQLDASRQARVDAERESR